MVEIIEKYVRKHGETQVIKWLFLLGLLLHILAAIFSEGYHKLDEQDGIMRFVGLKLGLVDLSEMSQEWPWRIRPWIQPSFYVLLGNLFPTDNPFTLNFIFRLFSSLVGFASLVCLFKYFKQFLNDKKSELIYLSFLILIWYFPFFHARPTAENFGISFFVFGFSLLLNKEVKIGKYIGAGFLFGLSFYFRFQMAIMIASSCLWLLAFNNLKIKNFSLILLGFFLCVGFNYLVDYWGYGEWVFTPWMYFEFNILKGGVASFGVDPWYKYFTKVFIKGIPPFSFFFIIPFGYMWIKQPKSAFTWITLPFFVIHCLISHKELRFIFGLGLFAPMAITIFLEKFKLLECKPWKKFIHFSLIINFAALAIASLKPAAAQMAYYKVLYNQNINRIYYFSGHPRHLPFYTPQGVEYIKTNTLPAGAAYIATMNNTETQLIKKLNRCQVKYSRLPQWIIPKMPEKWLKRSKNWVLWSCDNI